MQQFYSVLHSSPRYLYRFYTDESTVTHADCGIDGDSPTSVTVTSQKVSFQEWILLGSKGLVALTAPQQVSLALSPELKPNKGEGSQYLLCRGLATV